MATPPAKLYFFEARGRSEVIKLLMEAGKMPYENVTFGWDNWPEFQKNMPYGKCPTLEIDGKMIGQSIAIALYVAEKCGFNGSSIDERIVIHQALLIREEVMVAQIPSYQFKEPTIQAKNRKILYDKYPHFLQIYTDMIKENSQGKDFVLGDKFSAADACIYAAFTTMEQEWPELFENYPEVAALRKRVAQIDGIKQHLESRKVTAI